MGKRSHFPRIAKDKYRTPLRAVMPLLPHLPTNCTFVEPCAGDGRLIEHLRMAGHHCAGACDVEPDVPGIRVGNAAAVRWSRPGGLFITNPPWSRELLHPIIRNLSAQLPTFLLFDAGWLFSEQAASFGDMLRRVIALPRIKWIEGSQHGALDDACWYEFDATRPATPTRFYLRGERPGHPGMSTAT